MNNLKQVGLAFRQWELDHGDKSPMQVPFANGSTMELVGTGVVYPHFHVLSNELNSPKPLICPQDTLRSKAYARAAKLKIDTFDGLPTDFSSSYFVGVDADLSRPEMFLAGDDNLVIHSQRVHSGLASIWTNSPVSWATDRHIRCKYVDLRLPPIWRNVAFADGSSRELSDQLLRDALVKTGVAKNRLAIP